MNLIYTQQKQEKELWSRVLINHSVVMHIWISRAKLNQSELKIVCFFFLFILCDKRQLCIDWFISFSPTPFKSSFLLNTMDELQSYEIVIHLLMMKEKRERDRQRLWYANTSSLWCCISCTQSGSNNLINYDKLFWLRSTNIK